MSKKNKKGPPAGSTGRNLPGAKGMAPVAVLPAPETEPVAERRPIPVLLIPLLVLLVYVGDMYLMDHGADVMGKAGPFPRQVFDPFRSYQEVMDRNPESEGDKLLKMGRARFELYCGPCHQSSGAGNPGTGIPPLAGSEWVKTSGAGRAIRIVLNSVKGPIQVLGTTFDNPAMPPWGPQLTDEDIAAILSYVRANNNWGNKAAIVKPGTVKQIRDANASHSEQWTADELLKVPETE